MGNQKRSEPGPECCQVAAAQPGGESLALIWSSSWKLGLKLLHIELAMYVMLS